MKITTGDGVQIEVAMYISPSRTIHGGRRVKLDITASNGDANRMHVSLTRVEAKTLVQAITETVKEL